jgi:hypothetical protein
MSWLYFETGTNQFDSILKTFKAAKPFFLEALSCCEYIDAESMKCVEENLGLKSPIGNFSFYMLMECSGSDENEIRNKMGTFLRKGYSEGMIEDCLVAKDSEETEVNIQIINQYTYIYLIQLHIGSRLKSTI